MKWQWKTYLTYGKVVDGAFSVKIQCKETFCPKANPCFSGIYERFRLRESFTAYNDLWGESDPLSRQFQVAFVSCSKGATLSLQG